MSDPVHFLAAEIPQPDRHILGSIRMPQHDRLDLDAMRERTAFNKSIATKSSAQRCLPDITFTDQQHLRLILGNAVSQAAKIDSHGTSALPDQLRQRLHQRITVKLQLSSHYRAVSNLRGQRGQLIAVEPQRLEAGELADLRGQRGQLIPVEPSASGGW